MSTGSTVLFAFDPADIPGDEAPGAPATSGGPASSVEHNGSGGKPSSSALGEGSEWAAAPAGASMAVDKEPLVEDGHQTSSADLEPAEPATRWSLVLIMSVWFAQACAWFLLLIVIVPSQLAAIVGDEKKGRAIGIVLGSSTPVVIVGAPLVGVLSDRVRSRLGRRRPLMAVGALAFSASFFWLVAGSANSVAGYALRYTLLRCSELLLSAPFNGLIADVTPEELRGFASGLMASAANVGNFAGAAVGVQYTSLGPGLTALGVTCTVLLAATATCLAAHEADSTLIPPMRPLSMRKLAGDLVAPLLDHDFAWVFATRFIFQMGVYTVQEFLQYYFRDCVPLPQDVTPETAVSYGMLCLMTAAVITAGLGGVATDRMGGRRKVLVYVASGAMASSCCGVAFSDGGLVVTLALLVIFGLGFGCYLAVDFAMVLDVLPDPAHAAKDMAVWSIALTLPQMLATPIGGVLLDVFQRIGRARHPESKLGYQLVFSVASFYLVLSSWLVKHIKGVK